MLTFCTFKITQKQFKKSNTFNIKNITINEVIILTGTPYIDRKNAIAMLLRVTEGKAKLLLKDTHQPSYLLFSFSCISPIKKYYISIVCLILNSELPTTELFSYSLILWYKSSNL